MFERLLSTRSFAILCVALLLQLNTAIAQSPMQSGAVDLILTNGQVRTPSGWAEAVAIRDGIIVAVGDSVTIEAMRDRETEFVDLDGDTVLPGLHDSHVHALFAGLEQFACGFEPGASPQAIAAAVSACVAETSAGAWIQGGNWVAAVFEPGQQNRAFLDAVAPDNPLLLNDEAHHSVWVNSMALEIAGITRDTPDPEGGIIEHDASGEPNGLLRESAVRLVARKVPPASEALRREALILATNQMLSFGITSFTVASVRTPDIGPLSALSEEGLIKQRVRGCIVWAPEPEEVNSMGEMLIAARGTYARPRFSPDCVKIFLDGVPTESHTGAMLEPYEDANTGQGDDRPEKGLLLIPQDILDKAVTRFDAQGLHIKFHAAGDAAVRAAIDAVAVARDLNGSGGPMHHVGHSTFVALEDIPRVREVEMAWEFSPYIWYPTPMAAVDVFAAVGEQRMQRWVPIKDALATGALVVAGSDWSVVPSVNPWLALETMVTRQMPGGSEETLGLKESVTLEEAFRIFSENGARLMGHRDKVGSIEVGMRADVIVTETNPFEVPITDVHATKVRLTFIDGENVFDAASPPRLTAH
jgi:predicted amidohydrolase YtcJ